MTGRSFRFAWAELRALQRAQEHMTVEQRVASERHLNELVDLLDMAPITGEDEDAWAEWRAWASE